MRHADRSHSARCRPRPGPACGPGRRATCARRSRRRAPNRHGLARAGTDL